MGPSRNKGVKERWHSALQWGTALKVESRMTIKFSRQFVLTAAGLAAGSVLGAAVTWADAPGYLFMDIDNDHAMVVQQQKDLARIFKQPAKVSGDIASAIAAGAQPVGDSVILVYQGKLYILPDKKVGSHLATHMVMGAAGAPMHDE